MVRGGTYMSTLRNKGLKGRIHSLKRSADPVSFQKSAWRNIQFPENETGTSDLFTLVFFPLLRNSVSRITIERKGRMPKKCCCLEIMFSLNVSWTDEVSSTCKTEWIRLLVSLPILAPKIFFPCCRRVLPAPDFTLPCHTPFVTLQISRQYLWHWIQNYRKIYNHSSQPEIGIALKVPTASSARHSVQTYSDLMAFCL